MLSSRLILQIVICLTISICFPIPGYAEKLLIANVEEVGAFVLHAKSRSDIVGGEIILGDNIWQIKKVSIHGLIGARRTGSSDVGEYDFAVFSSSFSDQSGSGKPWVAAKNYKNCEKPYNSFLALYRVTDSEKVTALGQSPYAGLTNEMANSDDSVVYCFASKPPVDD